jgi:hypothetical protein
MFAKVPQQNYIMQRQILYRGKDQHKEKTCLETNRKTAWQHEKIFSTKLLNMLSCRCFGLQSHF